MKLTTFEIKINKDIVLDQIDCKKDSDIYQEVCEEYDEIIAEAYEKIEPIALLEFGDISEYKLVEKEQEITEALYSITSVGRKMSEWSTRLFGEGDYLCGMLVDAIADNYLFQMDHQLKEHIIAMCKERKCGVLRRLEAPQDISMTVQKKAWEISKANDFGIGIKESFMYDPVKTTCQVYLTSKKYGGYEIEHDCSSCTNVGCKMRNLPYYEITVEVKKGSIETIKGKKEKSLMVNLQQAEVFQSVVCGGRGTCGKCKIQVIEGEIPVTTGDQAYFSERELQEGYRLSCLAFPKSNCTIRLDSPLEEKMDVLLDYQGSKQEIKVAQDHKHGIAVDIGTTTIAMQCIDLETGDVIDTYSSMNKQRVKGADVIRRIELSNEGEGELLKKLVQEVLIDGIRALTEKTEVEVEQMVIGANTTMVHLLMGYSCETLGVFPFTPVNIEQIQINCQELLGIKEFDFEVIIVPGISTYVGGDITAGLFALDMDQKERVSVLVDLGTNGELAIGNKEKILVASTAAGPAFEGGNIRFGIGSVKGAICGVDIEHEAVNIRTIGDKEPVGICGTGVIDITYELMKEEWLDETGRLVDDYFDSGYTIAKMECGTEIIFDQKDIREIQLAKSSVRAGIETLIEEYGVTYEEIDHIYIAGGFGHKMDINKAIGIGLLPEACTAKIEAVGNTCLQGTNKCFVTQDATKRLANIISASQEVSLATSKSFNEYYMDYMYFE